MELSESKMKEMVLQSALWMVECVSGWNFLLFWTLLVGLKAPEAEGTTIVLHSFPFVL